MTIEFSCRRCAATTPSLEPSGWRCSCGGAWSLPAGPPFDVGAIDERAGGVWRYRRQIRLPQDCPALSLGEGSGRWLRLGVGDRSDGAGPWLACAHLEPTASFKARGTSVLIAWARLAAAPPLIEDSSGNAGGAVAAYAAAAGMACRVYVPSSAPRAKKALLASFGAEIVEVEGPRPRATEAAQADDDGTYCSHAWNPMFLEGIKTLAFQWFEEHGDHLPRRVYAPAGQGSVILGLHHGFQEIAAAFPEFEPPALIAVQHRSMAPLAPMVDAGGNAPEARSSDLPSLADGIAIPDPVRRADVARAVVASGGRVVVVGNHELRDAAARLASRGLWVEPTAAVGLAGHAAANDDDDTLVVLTGHGLKAATR